MDELHEVIRVLRYRILVICLLMVLGIGAAALWLQRSPSEYVATTRLFISGAIATSQYDAQQGGMYAQDRVVSYEKLINSRALAQRTIDALGLDMAADTLASHVTSTSFPDAAVIDVSVTADSPELARDITNGLADQFIAMASALETPRDSATPVVQLTVIDKAEEGTPAQLLPAKLIYIFGGLAGLFAGLIVSFLWETYTRRIRDADDVYSAMGEHPIAQLPASSTDLRLDPTGEASEEIARLRVNLAAVDGSMPHTVALAALGGRGAQLTRRFTAEAGVNLVDALVAETRTAVLLVLDPSPGIEDSIKRYARKARKKSGRHIPVQFEFDKSLLDRETIADQLRKLHNSYEFVVVVMPPLNQFAHAAAVAPAVDGVVAVGIYHRSTRRDIEGHMAELRRSGAASMGAAFVRRTLVRRPRPSRATPPNRTSTQSVPSVAVAEAPAPRGGDALVSANGQRPADDANTSSRIPGLTVR